MANPNPSPAPRFKPGQSGNPAGSSKARRISDRLKSMLDAAGEDLPGVDIPAGKNLADVVATKLVQIALSGDLKAMALLLDRTEGKVAETIKAEIENTPHVTPEGLSPRMEAALEAFGYVKASG